MPRDIRNIERGACIEGCRSCPNFLSVEPGRVLCDYCGCPPTKHEVVQPHSLLSIGDQANCEFKLNTSKEIGRITELKNDGMCFPASRTSSNDSGCYISSFGSASTSTSASSSSCSPYISEEEVEGVEDDCFVPHKEHNCENELSANDITPNLTQGHVELKSKDNCCAGVYNCSSTEIVVKIRNNEQENHALHNSLINATELNTSHFRCRTTQIEVSGKETSEEQLTYPNRICVNSAYITCKRKDNNSPIAEKECCKEEDESLIVIPAAISSGEDIVTVEEKRTLQGMGQLEIGDDRTGSHDLPDAVEHFGENKIIRAEGDCDVSDHNRKTNIGVSQCERRSECTTLI